MGDLENISNIILTPKHIVNSSQDKTKSRITNEWAEEEEIREHEWDGATVFNLHADNCLDISFSALKGTVYGINGEGDRSATVHLCSWSIVSQARLKYIYVQIESQEDPCYSQFVIGTLRPSADIGNDSKPTTPSANRNMHCQDSSFHFLTEAKNARFFLSAMNLGDPVHMPKFKLNFKFFNKDGRKRLSVKFKTPHSGHVTQWGYGGKLVYLCAINASYVLVVPEGQVVMLSFSRFDMNDMLKTDSENEGLWLYSVNKSGGRSLIFHKNGQNVLPTNVYTTSLLFHFKTQERCRAMSSGFKALFSLHPASQRPPKLDNDLFNCSTPAYNTFREHLDCNMEYECQGNEDEGQHCPYSSPRCKGFVSSGNKCFRLISFHPPISAYAGQKECQKRKGDLAQISTESEWDGVNKIFQYGKRFRHYSFGLRSGDSTFPDIYKYVLKWFDNSIAQTVSAAVPLDVSWRKDQEMCGALNYNRKLRISFKRCTARRGFYNFICQAIVQQPQWTPVVLPVTSFPFSSVESRTGQSLVACSGGHVTHSFLLCDLKSRCRMDNEYLKECGSPGLTDGSDGFVTSMFVCDDAMITLHYTLVCDFRDDCDDASDELFCIYRETCAGFRCHNGQCVDRRKRCNWDRDCLDESDEANCEEEVDALNRTFTLPWTVRVTPPVRIDFDNNGHFTKVRLQESDPCHDTHFRCSTDYCLPVYLRCNGFKDCPWGEDERECREYQCPGFYRCRSSSVCVHADHLCDGWPHCPQRDDEWLCHVGCPLGCACQGHAFVCSHSFPVISFPRMRYLDAAGSGMKLRDVTGHVYLVWLSLARCGLRHVTEMDLPNLRILDLSQNQISSLHIDVFLTLINLKTLLLSRNPLVYISKWKSKLTLNKLHTLDLSHTALAVFSSENISCFPHMTRLNISFSSVDTVLDTGFSATPNLTKVDLRGNALQNYPQDVIKNLHMLRSIVTDDFRLCCRQSLPDTFPADGSCFAPTAQAVSSCEDLLRYTHHRVLLFAVMLVAILGNITCLVCKVCVRKNATSSPSDVLMTNLGVVDLLMGTYCMVIVVADWTYRGQYFFFNHVWTSSYTCKAASVLALISYEASAFTICLITLQGLLTTFSHKIQYSLSKRSTLLACVAIWTVACTIALVPTLPALSRWRFHGHSDNCLPLSVKMKNLQGRNYAFAVTIVLHLVVSSASCLGQVFIYWFKKSHINIALSSAQKSPHMAIGTRDTPIVILDCVRRFVFALVVDADHASIHIPYNVNVAVAIFVVPINSALNPLLYALSVALEKRQQAAEYRLLERLSRRLQVTVNLH